jgi:hypothetical protein
VSKELAFEQRFRDGSAVNRYERLGSAGAGRVDAAGEKLFASARFPYEQYSHAATRCHLRRQGNDFADCRALSDYVSIPPLLRGLLQSGCNNSTVPLSRGQQRPARGIVIERIVPSKGVGLI